MLNIAYKTLFVIYGGDVGFCWTDSVENGITSGDHLK